MWILAEEIMDVEFTKEEESKYKSQTEYHKIKQETIIFIYM